MKLIAISGIKGGVGAASVAANVAFSFHHLNRKVVIVDFDRRNFIRVLFSMMLTDQDGWAVRLNQMEDWTLAFHQSPEGVPFLPFGDLSDSSIRLETAVSHQCLFDSSAVYSSIDHQCSEMVETLSNHFDYMIVNFPAITFTPQFSELLRLLHSHVDMHLMVVNPDVACYSILNSKGNLLRCFPKLKLLANKHYSKSKVSGDFAFYMNQYWEDFIVSDFIHYDEALSEAAANLKTVGSFSPECQAAVEFKTLALWMIANLSRMDNEPDNN